MNMKAISLICAMVLSGCSAYKGLVFRVPTVGMAPTVNEGDSVFCDPIYYKYSPVRRGDVVVVIDPDGRKNPSGREEMYVKRVVGLGGDKVQIKSGKVYVNDVALGGPFASGKYFSDYPVEDYGPVAVPQGEYFLVGDNLANSYDSRLWQRSTVKLADFYGKVTQIKDNKTGAVRDL